MNEIKERGIPFSKDMVLAVMRGDKTQTRRVLSPQPHAGIRKSVFVKSGWEDGHGYEIKSPYGQAGDRLWVREELRGDGQPGNKREGIVRYGADGEMVLPCASCGFVHCRCEDGMGCAMDVLWEWKRPVLAARYCPRWASRTYLEIVGIGIERLQSISESDAKAEGVQKNWIGDNCPPEYDNEYLDYRAASVGDYEGFPCFSARDSFMTLWDSINAKRGHGWDSNPWVWAISFKVLANNE